MPRVNRDLQRRLAARRERERRRPTTTERRYRVAPTVEGEAAVEPDEGGVAEAPVARPAVRGAVARPAPRPFSDYGAEYAYVVRDLRRIVLVVGGLLVLIAVLAFVLKP
jgi:hypothetical protein